MRKLFFVVIFLKILSSSGVNAQERKVLFDLEEFKKEIETKIHSREFEDADELLIKLMNQNFKSSFEKDVLYNYYKGKLYAKQKNDSAAFRYLYKGFSLVQEKRDQDTDNYYIKYSKSLGCLFRKNGNYETSLSFYRRVYNIAEKNNDSVNITEALLSLGSIKEAMKEIDSAEYYYLKGTYFIPKGEEGKYFSKQLYSNLIGTSIKSKHFDTAEAFLNKSLDIFNEERDTLMISEMLFNMGKIKMHRKDYNNSLNYYNQSLSMIDGRDEPNYLLLKSNIFHEISEIYFNQKEYQKAYDNVHESDHLYRDYADLRLESQLTEIEEKYLISEKERYAQIQKNKRQRAEVLLLVLGGSSVVLIIVLWLLYRTNMLKQKQVVLEFEKENYKKSKEIDRVKQESQLKILKATLDGKENERRNIAEILHDNVSALLSSANLHLYAVRAELKDNAPEEIDKIELIINEASEKIRDLSHKLISSVLMKFGLASAVEDICEKFSNSQLRMDSEAINIKRYEIEYEVALHRIIEELVNNSLKHSEATKISINLEEIDNNIEIRVYDNGIGFDANKLVHKDGLGLTHISARLNSMGGEFDIKSSRERGTRIFIRVPIPNQD